MIEDNLLELANIRAMKSRWPDLREPSLPLVRNSDIPIPSLENRRRVSGPGADADPQGLGFSESGFEQIRNVINIAEVWGIKFNAETILMDWGVGCGRLARHVPQILRNGFIGTDVDPINIQWSKDNIPFGNYQIIEANGNFDLQSSSIDVIYSHSVLTHLGESDQNHWLRELGRVIRPGGIIILTVHAWNSAAQIANWAKKRDNWNNYLDLGFIDSGNSNPDINDVIPDGYYRDVSHSPCYIRENWPKFGVEVLDIMIGGFGPIQDTVVCTKG